MGTSFEELDYCQTRLGELSLRRRRFPKTGDKDVYEVKLGDEFLMSSLFPDAEIALARLGLAKFSRPIDVVVGGLGLGYTAVAALDCRYVSCLLVIETLSPVIDWHRRGLLPMAEKLVTDSRCRLVQGDFFELSAPGGTGFDAEKRGRRFDAILLDIDHSPADLLHLSHGGFYETAGLQQLAGHLQPGGVFALWSNDVPDEIFAQTLALHFAEIETHIVKFDNPLQNCQSANTVYVAHLD